MQDKTSSHAPIPTELNIAPRGKSWLHGELIDGEHGHPTRQSMETAERAAINQQLTTGKHLGTVNNSTPRSVDWHSHFVPEAGTKLYAAPVLEAPAAVAVPDEREAFEQWLMKELDAINWERGLKDWYFARRDDGNYVQQAPRERWEAWQAGRAALAATPAAVQTHAEAAAALCINSALHRIRAGNHSEAIAPLEHALRTLATNSARIVTHNPHTGKPRDARDMASDPEGKLIVAPGPLFAAAEPAPQQSYVSISGELKPDVSVYSTPAAAPAGWKLVPIEPTAEMLESAGATDRDGTPATYKTLYMAMVGAALNPPPACDTPRYCNSVQRCTAMDEQRAAAAPVVLPEPAREILEDAVSILSSINHGKQHAVKVGDEVCYWQRQEWIDWAEKEVLPKLRALLAQAATGRTAQAQQPDGFVPAAAYDRLQALCDSQAARILAAEDAEPVHWRAVLDPEQVPQQLKASLHAVGFRDQKAAAAWIASELDFNGWRYTLEPLYAAPQAATATGLPAQAVELSDAELIALNAGECFFSESPSKYPEAGHGTQYHGGATGVIGFARAALALRADPAAYSQKFQQRVQPWMMACFGPEISADRIERNHRFLEEALELVQCLGCTASEAHQLVDYVYGRPWGDPAQEAGGVMVTLAALCLANGLDMHACGETELARIWTKVEAIRAKQAAKPKHSPLPISAPHLPSVQESVEKLPRYTYGYKGDDWGMNQSLRSYEAPDGAFLRRDEVLNAIAAITAKGNEV